MSDAEPETALITDAELTSAAGNDGSDPVVGQQMIARDRFHRPMTETPHPNTGDDAAPADEPQADQPGGDEALLADPKPAAAAAAGAGDGGEITAAGTDSAEAAGEKGAGLRVYSDSAYGTGAVRAAYRDAGQEKVIKPKPLRPAVPGGFTLDDFTIDEPRGTVTCPAEHTRPMSPKRTVTSARCASAARCGSGAPAPPTAGR